MSVLFFGKQGDFHCERAAEFTEMNFADATIVMGRAGEPFPRDHADWTGEYLVSYLSRWIIPRALLNRASVAAINFHPGPPSYPGIGCTNFALYNEESVFGVTCHHMAEKVDTGPIIAVERFPVFPSDTVYSLTQRCYAHISTLFFDIATRLIQKEPLPQARERWERKPYTRSELNALCRISPEMSSEEVRRRVRAVTFPNAPGAYVEIGGVRFEYAE